MKNIAFHLTLLLTITYLPASYAVSNSSSPYSYHLWEQAQEARQLSDYHHQMMFSSSPGNSWQHWQQSKQALELRKKAEKKCLDNLYESYKKNHQFYKTEKIDFDYALELLSAEVERLTEESSPTRIANTQHGLIVTGLIFSTVLFIYFGGIETLSHFLNNYFKLRRGTFNSIWLPASTLEELKSSKVTFKEKKYLKQFTVNEVDCSSCQWYYDGRQEPDYYPQWQNDITELSSRDKEKLKYIALQKEVLPLKNSLYKNASYLAMKFLGAFACGGIPCFFTAYTHPEDITEKLKNAKGLYALLTQEQHDRLSLSPKKI